MSIELIVLAVAEVLLWVENYVFRGGFAFSSGTPVIDENINNLTLAVLNMVFR